MMQNAARCECGTVELGVEGRPIVATTCHCDGCRAAGRRLQSLPGAPPILDAEGGTPYVLFRKDRVQPLSGVSALRAHKLTDDSPTRRAVATCCNTFMFLDFTKGHWITIPAARLAHAPAARTARRSPGFVARLMIAWAAMRFRTPTIDYVHGALNDV